MKYRRDPPPPPRRELPPYNGFGSEEDSLCSCMGLLPKPPKRDFIKFMEKDRHGLDSNVIRFLAKMNTNKPIDMDRRFIISYFMSDDTILVFEPPVRNSGKYSLKLINGQHNLCPRICCYKLFSCVSVNMCIIYIYKVMGGFNKENN